MQASDFFTPARLQEMRDEILRDGFAADNFLADQPDTPVFGVNLACLYPFPREVAEIYESLSSRLTAIDPGVYAYPIWETHVTIATFINFTKQLSPTAQRVAELKQFMQQITAQLQDAFADVKPFELWIERPIISRKAAIFPLSDPSDSIAHIRNRVVEALGRNQSLKNCLEGLGLNIPPLVHSTIMRFKKAPTDPRKFLSTFDEVAATVPRTAMRINEIYITTETKPYMRAGQITHRFKLE
jgi:hypothetical protein